MSANVDTQDPGWESIWDEHKRRVELTRREYDPLRGIGCCGERIEVDNPTGRREWIPRPMADDPLYPTAMSNLDAWEKLRCKHDFEFWCARCVKIKDKLTGADVAMTLNTPQRRVFGIIDADRLAGHPLRVIMLKARQWGGSTLVQMVMAWIQSYWRRNWNSLICAHVKDTSATIRGMYTKLLASYPENLWDGDQAPRFVPFERSQNVREISGRGCRVTLGSAENQEAVRGGDYAMAHLSEVAFWASSTMKSPEKFVQAICGSIATVPLTLVVMESTANGVGNYFHREWLRAERGESDKRPVFVPWHEIDIYRQSVERDEARELWQVMDSYEQELWRSGLDLEQIKWYHNKRREYASHTMMQAEYPSTPVEAFVNSGHNVFAAEHIERLRSGCVEAAETGELERDGFHATPLGCMKVWTRPVKGHRYTVAVDIGGRSPQSDWSVIAVIDTSGELPEVVAQWRGHIDHDRLGELSERVARWYNMALLVIEANTLETENTEGDNSLFILERLRRSYRNIYLRQSYDTLTGRSSWRVGFHTNVSTKKMVITGLIGLVRDGAYIERDADALNEMATYEITPRGAYAARLGCHDDILMTRAIALHVALNEYPAPPRDPTLEESLRAIPRW